MTNEELKKLKDGDIVRNRGTGNSYIVQDVIDGVPSVSRTIEIRNASEWEVSPPAPTSISLVEKITELEKLGWTFNENTNRWSSPDEVFSTQSLHSAWTYRNDHGKVFKVGIPTPSERRVELRAAGWSNHHGITWVSPIGRYFNGSLEAWVEMKKSV